MTREGHVLDRRKRYSAVIAALIGGVIVSLFGCAQWTPGDESARSTTGGLPPARIADEATVVDIIFWPLPTAADSPLRRAASKDPIAAFWERVDELSIPVEIRTALRANGLRAGKVQHIEQVLQQYGLPAPADQATKLLQNASVASDIAHSRHTIPFRSGEIQDVAIRQTRAGAAAVMVRLGEETIGKQLSQPQFLCSVQTRPTRDGNVEVRMWPKIEFGEMRQSFTSSDQAIRIDSARAAWTLHELTTTAVLGQNETLMVTATPHSFGLGKQMLTSQLADGSQETVAILMRVSRLPQPQL